MSTPDSGSMPGYNIALSVRSATLSAPIQLSNYRIGYALSQLGRLFDQVEDKTWYELDFDIRVSDPSEWPKLINTTIIATGSITQFGQRSDS